MPLEITEGRYRGWDAIFLTAGPLEVALAPGLGGRVLQATFEGIEVFRVEPRAPGAPGERRPAGGSAAGLVSSAGGHFAPDEGRALDEGPYRVRVAGRGERRTVWMESPLAAGVRLVRGVDVGGGVLSIGTRLERVEEGPAALAIREVAHLAGPRAVEIAGGRCAPPAGEALLVAERAAGPLRVEVAGGVGARVDFLPRPRPGAEYPRGASVALAWIPEGAGAELAIHAPLASLTKGEQAALSVVWSFARND
jgi:hypothetical protein